MEELTRNVLREGGLKIDESSKEDPLDRLEAWLGIPKNAPSPNNNNGDDNNDDEEDDEFMEDVAPFSEGFYKSLETLFIHAWKPEENDPSQQQFLVQRNPFLEIECPPESISVEKVLVSVRITRILRFWMELNVLGNHTMLGEEETEDERTSLSHSLFQIASTEMTPSGRQIYRLLYAIYRHVEQLPILQSQLYFYTQTLTRGDRNSRINSGVSFDVQSRLAMYQAAQDVTTKLNQQWEDHIDALEYILGEWYVMGSVDMRRQTRMHLGSVWTQFVARSGGGGGGGSGGGSVKMENTTSAGIRMTLRILHRILKGSTNTLQKSHEHLLEYHLIPLHRPSSMVLWRDQTSLLELYHIPLVQCIASLLQKKPEWIPKVISALLEPEIWNKGGNTPKLVLLLHEIDTYMGILPNTSKNPYALGDTLPILLRIVGNCMASDHSRLAERALIFIKTQNFLTILLANFESSLRILLPLLVKKDPSWNPTVRKMTYNVLKVLRDYDEVRFLKISEQCLPQEGGGLADVVTAQVPNPPTQGKAGGRAIVANDHGESIGPKDFSLKSAMGGWRPSSVPPSSSTMMGGTNPSSRMLPPSTRVPRGGGGGGTGRGGPPLTVTGVAPWSVSSTPPTVSRFKSAGGSHPPLEVTGVAPWAVQKASPPGGKRQQPAETSSNVPSSKGLVDEKDIPTTPKSRVLSYMEQIRPPELEGGVSSWSKTQMDETPTLLPELKFHDLVFGHDLGSGAFGSVRYARLIDRSRTRSHWAEYAVKIISTEKIKEMGYETSVQREVAVLRVLSHPGIARLVSSFRFQEGVYLVLEYASGGDLHSLLKKNGSLDHDSTRFVMGEVVAALASIHELGMIYCDLKPENIVITESGHIKLTDFGGCRPITLEAKELINTTAKNLLKDLRDGGWKPNNSKVTTTTKQHGFGMEDDSTDGSDHELEEDGDMENDLRIEGTTAYLPPEVILGGFPTFAADSWALGCVIYQCLSGRPPLLEVDDVKTKNRIVSFDAGGTGGGGNTGGISSLFMDTHSVGIEEDAKSLITSLLSRNATERPSMQGVAQTDFFMGANINIYTLYTQIPHPLDVGDVTPVADAQWTRRQFSSIWAPQPQSYDISIQSNSHPSRGGTTMNDAILEGPEGTTFFSKSMNPLDLNDVSNSRPPMPKFQI